MNSKSEIKSTDKEQQHREYFACKIAQRGSNTETQYVVFVAEAQDIMQWAGIRRVGEHDEGVQRVLKPLRVRQIRRFFEADARNIIPTGVVLAFDIGKATFTDFQEQLSTCLKGINLSTDIKETYTWGKISFDFVLPCDDVNKPAFVVDGQHRLNGMNSYDPTMPILVMGLLDATRDEQAFQFVVINNKAAKVPTTNVKSIISDVNLKDLEARILDAGVSFGDYPALLKETDRRNDSPFHHLLDWPLNPDKENRLVDLTAIESCIRSVNSAFKKLEDDDDDSIEIFFAIWRSVKALFPTLWGKNNKFMSKVNLVTLNDFLVSRLVYKIEDSETDFDVFDMDEVESECRSRLKSVSQDFWLAEWNYKLQDNAIVRGTIKDDLQTILLNKKNGRPWYSNLSLVTASESLDMMSQSGAEPQSQS